MGNRAHVIFKSGTTISPAVYLHWNGGANTIYAALKEMHRRGVRKDANYQCARFVGLMHELMMPEQLSLGIVNGPKSITQKALNIYDHGDNGVYVIETIVATNKIKVRRFSDNKESSAEEVAKEFKDYSEKGVQGGSEVWLKNFPEEETNSASFGM